MLLPLVSFLDRIARLVAAATLAEDKREWLADKLAWRRFWKRIPLEHKRNLAFDQLHGTLTAVEVPLVHTGISSENAVAGNGVYRPIWESEFHAALALLKLPFEEFTFVDLGSGKGKGLLLAAGYPFKAILGIEYSPGLHAVAASNLMRFRSRDQKCTRIQTVLADAETYSLPPGPLICFIFNSFDRPTMRRIIKRLDRDYAGSNPLYVVYVNVRRVAEIGNALDDLGSLQTVARSRTVLVLSNIRNVKEGMVNRSSSMSWPSTTEASRPLCNKRKKPLCGTCTVRSKKSSGPSLPAKPGAKGLCASHQGNTHVSLLCGAAAESLSTWKDFELTRHSPSTRW